MNRKNITIIVSVALIGIATTIFAYHSAKESYRAVGFNDGAIMQKVEIIEKLNNIKKLEDCPSDSKAWTEVISVKAISVLVLKTNEGSFQFCIMQ